MKLTIALAGTGLMLVGCAAHAVELAMFGLGMNFACVLYLFTDIHFRGTEGEKR